MHNTMKEANKIFERINRKLIDTHRGKIVAIDSDTGQYFIGDNEIAAYKKASQAIPNKQFVFKRIGFKSTHFVGAV